MAYPYPDTTGGTYIVSPEMRPGSFRLSMKRGELVVEQTFIHRVVAPIKNATRRQVIMNTPNLPIPYQSISPDGMGVCVGVEAERVPDNPHYWDVTVTYSSSVEDSQGSGGGASVGNAGQPPTAWVPQWQAVAEPYDYSNFVDVTGQPYTNGAGALFTNPPRRKKNMTRWDFFQFEPITTSEVAIAARNESTNNANWTRNGSTYNRHTLKLNVTSITTGYYYGQLLRLVGYSITYRPSTWVSEIANVGDSFVFNNKVYPYIYDSDGTVGKNIIQRAGFLGTRNVPLGASFLVGDGEPSGGTVERNGNVYARRPTITVPYHIKRLELTELGFSSFLR